MLIATKRPRSESVERRLHAAIRACYAPLFTTQERLEDATGIPQQTISKWVRGVSTPDPYELAEIEQACDAEAVRRGEESLRRPLGWISRQAGLVAEVVTVPDAIVVDPELNDDVRLRLTRAYRGAVDHVRQVRKHDAGDDGPLGL